MVDVSPDVLAQLEQAQSELAMRSEAAEGPPISNQVTAADATETVFGAAGSGTAKHVLLDHYFTSTARVLWAYAGGSWRGVAVGAAEEQGVAQVAFTAGRVDAWWNASNKLTILRCWKTF